MRDLGVCILLASVVGSPHLLTEFAHVISYTRVPCMYINPLCGL